VCCTNLRNDVHQPLVDVLERFAVAIVIKIDLNKSLRILAKALNHGEDFALLLRCRIPHLEDWQEYFVKENLDFFLMTPTLVNPNYRIV
jgi:hypothetical protein